MSVPRLHIIADRGACTDDQAFLAAVAELSTALLQVDAALHVRIKEGDRQSLARQARRVTRPLSAAGTAVLLNGTVTEAESLGFDGTHWPQALIPSGSQVVPTAFLLGASVHDDTSLMAAEAAGARYVMFGPLWPPGSKTAAGVGLAALARFATRARVPVVAVGGVTPARVAECLEAGAYGVAVVSGVMRSLDRPSAVAAYALAVRNLTQVRSQEETHVA